jgi:hypothetical protein
MLFPCTLFRRPSPVEQKDGSLKLENVDNPAASSSVECPHEAPRNKDYVHQKPFELVEKWAPELDLPLISHLIPLPLIPPSLTSSAPPLGGRYQMRATPMKVKKALRAKEMR